MEAILDPTTDTVAGPTETPEGPGRTTTSEWTDQEDGVLSVLTCEVYPTCLQSVHSPIEVSAPHETWT
jgi:hypothetical protein